jgi:ABC-type polysaccharide/polyol phosphate transport system ATPase subunit
MPDIAIDCRNLVKFFRKQKIPIRLLQDRILRHRLHGERIQIDALRGLSLTVHQGEWIGLFGPNGSGKSTLLKVLAGIIKPDYGTVQINGRLSCFFELGVGFHSERRADENIYLHGLLQGMRRREILQMTDHIIDVAGVRSHCNLPLKCYSTGMRFRLAFAAASQVDADIFLFDEILAVGDTQFQLQCWEHLASLKRSGKTGLLVSHNLNDLKKTCDRILFIDHGQITGSLEEEALKAERSPDAVPEVIGRI